MFCDNLEDVYSFFFVMNEYGSDARRAPCGYKSKCVCVCVWNTENSIIIIIVNSLRF